MDEENNASLKKDTITSTETISIKSNGINQNISNINLDINFDKKMIILNLAKKMRLILVIIVIK